jgi:predicted flavoprotein YhiN
MQKSEIARSRDRSQKAENRKQLQNATKNHIDMKMKKVSSTAKKLTFENSTLLSSTKKRTLFSRLPPKRADD